MKKLIYCFVACLFISSCNNMFNSYDTEEADKLCDTILNEWKKNGSDHEFTDKQYSDAIKYYAEVMKYLNTEMESILDIKDEEKLSEEADNFFESDEFGDAFEHFLIINECLSGAKRSEFLSKSCEEDLNKTSHLYLQFEVRFESLEKHASKSVSEKVGKKESRVKEKIRNAKNKGDNVGNDDEYDYSEYEY